MNVQSISPSTTPASERQHVVHIGPPGSGQKASPDVQVLRNNNNIVETIVVRCGCGEQIRLDCVYESDQPRESVQGENE